MNRRESSRPYAETELIVDSGRRSFNGFVFSLDALFSVIVLTVIISSIAFHSARTHPESLFLVNLEMKTNDVLVILDKLEYFSRMNGTEMTSFINVTLGSDVGWRLNVEYYNYTFGNQSFALYQSMALGGNSSDRDDTAAGTRVFVVKNSTSVIHYGRASLITWIG